jgi:hypothetical protein
MVEELSQDYYARREAEQRAAAKAAKAKQARAIHLQMAYHYAMLGRQLDERDLAVMTTNLMFGGHA